MKVIDTIMPIQPTRFKCGRMWKKNVNILCILNSRIISNTNPDIANSYVSN